MRYSKANLSKIESILKIQGYTIRYEKGNFNSGFCLLNTKKVIVVNKFYDVKQRMDSFYNIVHLLENLNETILTPEDQEIWNQLMNKSAQLKLVA